MKTNYLLGKRKDPKKQPANGMQDGKGLFHPLTFLVAFEGLASNPSAHQEFYMGSDKMAKGN
jgi:hypothetical protein